MTDSKYTIAVAHLLRVAIPVWISLLFMNLNIFFLLMMELLAVILTILLILVIAGIFALLLPDRLIRAKQARIIAVVAGLSLALLIFHHENRFYGAPRSCFKLATGTRPLFEVQVLDFQEDAWTDYAFTLKYKATKEFNQKVAASGRFTSHQNGFATPSKGNTPADSSIFKDCYSRSGSTYSSSLCLDSTMQYGLITHSSE